MAERTVYLLVVGPDPVLHEEASSAAEALQRTRTVVLHANSLRDGVETARNRNPQIVIVELGSKTGDLPTFTADVEHVSPGTAVIGAYRVDPAGEGTDEGQLLVSALRNRVRDFIRRPVSSTELQEVLDRHLEGSGPAGKRQKPGIVIDFVSNKGGVGKSTLSISAACLLAKRYPGRVLLVDASLQLGVCAASLDLRAETTIVDAVQELARLDETLLREISVRHSSGLQVLAAPNDAVEATQVGETEISRVLSVARQGFDYVIVDTFPLVDAVAVAGLDVADVVCCVTSDTVPNVVGMSRYIGVLERLGVSRERMRILLNHPQPRFSGALTASDVATRLNRNIDHVIPFDRKVLVGLNVGVPYALAAPKWYGFGKALQAVADEFTANLASMRAEAADQTAARERARGVLVPEAR